jgi:septal ring factor EnvC (AmiA/AmiB activator)
MEIVDVVKLAIEGGTTVIFAVVVLAFARLLSPAIELMKSANAQLVEEFSKMRTLYESELRDEKEKVSRLRREFDDHRQSTGTEIRDLKRQLVEKDAEIDALKKTIRELRDGHQKEIKKMQDEMRVLREERDALKKRLDDLITATRLTQEDKLVEVEKAEK